MKKPKLVQPPPPPRCNCPIETLQKWGKAADGDTLYICKRHSTSRKVK